MKKFDLATKKNFDLLLLFIIIFFISINIFILYNFIYN